MTETQYLLTCLMEECNEVSQRCSKLIRFGRDEIQPNQEKSNVQRLHDELTDLYAVFMMLADRGLFPKEFIMDALNAKQAKVLKYMEYSRERGIISALS